MAFARLLLCVGGVYAMFLVWGIAQERLSVPFSDDGKTEKWNFALTMGALQSALSALSAFTYILIRKPKGESISQAIGWEPSKVLVNGNGTAKQNGNSSSAPKTSSKVALLRSYLYCALLGTFAAPFGFASLAHISYPAMVLGKSCKLIPVMLMNVLLYRRKFARHKYAVVALVTAGITVFMSFGDQKSNKHAKSQQTGSGSSVIGLIYLLINLAMDGVLNSTQDEIFSRYKATGQQMMLFMNVNSALLNGLLAILPLPYIPVLHPSTTRSSDLMDALQFLRAHPQALYALFQFAITGALGQLFIFETLQHFGSLTLVTITLTRKLFTMLLSVIIYRHKLTMWQYLGAVIVFTGISIEALMKRKEIHLKRVVQEKEKAKLKSL